MLETPMQPTSESLNAEWFRGVWFYPSNVELTDIGPELGYLFTIGIFVMRGETWHSLHNRKYIFKSDIYAFEMSCCKRNSDLWPKKPIFVQFNLCLWKAILNQSKFKTVTRAVLDFLANGKRNLLGSDGLRESVCVHVRPLLANVITKTTI